MKRIVRRASLCILDSRFNEKPVNGCGRIVLGWQSDKRTGINYYPKNWIIEKWQCTQISFLIAGDCYNFEYIIILLTLVIGCFFIYKATINVPASVTHLTYRGGGWYNHQHYASSEGVGAFFPLFILFSLLLRHMNLFQSICLTLHHFLPLW